MDFSQIFFKDVEIKNTYTFTVFNEQGKEVSTETITNVAMSKRYFLGNVGDLSISIGTMTESDFAKYQKDGKWLPGNAIRKDGIINTGSNAEAASATNQEWDFHRDTSEYDTYLFGTRIFSGNLKWTCTSIDDNSVTLSGSTTWGFHDYKSPLNKSIPAGVTTSGDEEPLVAGQGVYTQYVPGKEPITIEYEVQNYIFGIQLVDGGLFSNLGFMCSHFAGLKTVKRPTDTLNISATITVSHVLGQDNEHGSTLPFEKYIPVGNAGYGFGVAGLFSTGTPISRPTTISFTGLPIRRGTDGVGSGVIPTASTGAYFYLSSIGTSRPLETWKEGLDKDEHGYWDGFPYYYYFGNGDFYKKNYYKEQKEDGTLEDKEEYAVDKEGRKIFEWNNLEPKIITRYQNFNYFIRGITVDALGVIDIKNIPGNWGREERNLLRIGVGDGVTTRFYHPFVEQGGDIFRNGRVTGAIVVGDSNGAGSPIITHYSPQYFTNSDFILYSGDWSTVLYDTHSGPQNSTSQFEGTINSQTSYCRGYSKQKKISYFRLNPFDLQYYSIGNDFSKLIGNNEWIVYPSTAQINSVWAGTLSGKGISGGVTLVTAETIEGLKDSTDRIGIPGGSYQHDCTTIADINDGQPFRGKGYIAIKGDNGWLSVGTCYAGGLAFTHYESTCIRFSSNDIVPGYVEFSKPPSVGSVVYINVVPYLPLMTQEISLKGRYCISYGNEERDNGLGKWKRSK